MAITATYRYIRPGTGIDGNTITGVENFPRYNGPALTHATTSGAVRLVYFTPGQNTTVSTILTYSGSTAAGATPSLVRVGLYTVASNGDLTLVARSASDTAMYAGTQTEYPKALDTTGGYPASYTLVPGTRYAGAVIVVTGATAPTLTGATGIPAAGLARAPRLTAAFTGQTDLPTSIATGSLSSSGSLFYFGMV